MRTFKTFFIIKHEKQFFLIQVNTIISCFMSNKKVIYLINYDHDYKHILTITYFYYKRKIK